MARIGLRFFRRYGLSFLIMIGGLASLTVGVFTAGALPIILGASAIAIGSVITICLKEQERLEVGLTKIDD